jgi:hypothetical protein
MNIAGNITGFDTIAPYLTNPLVLVGFGLMLVYGKRRGQVGRGSL